jgi:AAA domain
MRDEDYIGEAISNRDGAPRRIELVAFDDIKLGKQRRYLVKGLIPRVGLTVVWGPPKSGKSFWTFDLLMHVALDWPYRDRRVDPGAVVYCAFEGQSGIEARKEAFSKRFLADDRDPVPFFLQSVTLDLVKDAPELIDAIGAKLGDTKPAAIVLDTLSRSLHGSESSDEDMSAYIRAADAIRETFDCAIIIVHHCGVDATRPRGHTSLTGAADAQLSVSRDAAENIIVTVEVAKDGPQGDTIASRLEVVEVDHDEDGGLITSCVIVPVDGAFVRPVPKRKLSDRQKLALDGLMECTITSGKAPLASMTLPTGIRVVDASAWREELYTRGVLDRDAGNPREEFKRIHQQLHARGLIGMRGELVWIA